MSSAQRNSLARRAWACLLLGLALLLTGGLRQANAGGQVAAPIVATVTLKLGQVWAQADAVRRPLQTGAPVRVGETIETDASGHVHLRFVDGAVVSLRPASRLTIAAYADPRAGGAIRLQIEQGSLRSITGRWGEADRQRFRLNTPLLAIGIQGTDFSVVASETINRIIVHAGAIVAAPFGGDCTPDAVGPCSSENARLLAADMSEQMLEFRKGELTPSYVPRRNLEEVQLAPKVGARPQIATAAKDELQPGVAEAATQQRVNELIPATAPLPPNLVWGRWAHAPVWPGDTLALPREEAAAGRERIAENIRYALYRLPQSEPLPNAGVIDLGLDAAQAHFLQGREVLPAQVHDGSLRLDFAARRFDTRLTLEAAPTGKVPFQAGGDIKPDGSFGLTTISTRLQGAYATGGSGPTAGYVFERATPQGMFMGISTWR